MDGHSHFAQLFPPALSSLFVIAERKQSWIYPSAITNKLLKTPLVFSLFERSQDPSLSPLFTYTLHLPRIELSNYQRNSRCERALCTALQREILITSARHYILSPLSPIFLPNTPPPGPFGLLAHRNHRPAEESLLVRLLRLPRPAFQIETVRRWWGRGGISPFFSMSACSRSHSACN